MSDLHETFFGEAWPSAICGLLEPGPTPVGEECMFCDEAIVDGDRGSWMQAVSMTDQGPAPCWHPAHRECQLRSVVGGLAHLAGRCSCQGGPGPTPEEKAMSEREEALAVWDIWTRRQMSRLN